MNEVLKTYQDRLINLNASNKSLVLKKTYKKRSFDIVKLLKKGVLDEKGLLSHIYAGKTTKYTLLDDPFKAKKQMLKALKARLDIEEKEKVEQLKKEVKDLNPLSKMQMADMIAREEEIAKEFKARYEDEKSKVDEDVEKLISYSNELRYLLREIEAVEKETGKYELFLGFPFVEGRFDDSTVVRAPILLIPVNISSKDNQWSISLSGDDILINKVFLYGYSKYNNVELKDFDTNFSSFEEIGEEPIKAILAYLKANSVEIEEAGSEEMLTFSSMKNEDFSVYDNGQMVLKNYFILGQFPVSNSIYMDYAKLLENPVEDELLDSLLLNKEKGPEIIPDYLSECDTFFYTGLDYSQEYAVSKLFLTDKLVIYGPPGTGKSYTISNIISDALCKGKRVLMVSKKKAALDVIYNKLADINSKLVLVHDANKNKRSFYQKIMKCLTKEALDFNLADKLTHDKIGSEVDKKLGLLEVLGYVLTDRRKFGISLQEMYVKSSAINSVDDERFVLYKLFRNNNFLNDITYEQLSEAMKIIVSNELLVDQYLSYRKFVDANEFMASFRHKLDLMTKEELKEYVESFKSFIASHKVEGDFGVFAKYYNENRNTINESMVNTFAKEYNEVINAGLVDEKKVGFLDITGLIDKIKTKEERKKNKKKFEDEQANYEKRFGRYFNVLKEADTYLVKLGEYLNDAKSDELKGKFYEQYDISLSLDKLKEAAEKIDDFDTLNIKISGQSPISKRVLDICYKITDSKEQFMAMIKHVEEFVILEHISNIEKQPEFDEFYHNFAMYLDIVDEVAALLKQKNSLTKSIATSVWNDSFTVFEETPNLKEFIRQSKKKRGQLPIRKFVEMFNDIVFTLFPCWLLSPETVSDILPLKQDMFDIIIFDEASQIFIEEAIPTIYRGKTVVIAGDDKQLQPTSIFLTKYDSYDEEETDITNIAAYEEESLLDLAKVNYPYVHLNYHYRSRYEELINFSNYAFYDGQLNISPNITNSKALKKPPIERIKVDGLWEDRKNNIEGSAVVDLVAEILKTRKKEETIGIITFNITQKDSIEDLLLAKTRVDDEFGELYFAEKQRLDGNEDISIFVKNIENVQGDERDIIIFSTGYAKNKEGKLSVNFGSLSQQGGENRLNVAISRAKRKIYIVTSIEPSELKVSETLNRGPKLLKSYLEYTKAVSESDDNMVKEVLKSISSEVRSFEEKKDEFVESVSEELKKEGHDIRKYVGASGSKIDIAVLHPETKDYILGIECDGNTYKEMPSVRERDVHRKKYLELRGWEIMRVWSADWWKDKKGTLNELNHLIEVLVNSNKKTMQTEMAVDIVSRLKNVNKDGIVYLKDRVFIKDTMTKETFDVNIDDDESKLSDFKLAIIGKSLGDIFSHKGYEYQIVGIKK